MKIDDCSSAMIVAVDTRWWLLRRDD